MIEHDKLIASLGIEAYRVGGSVRDEIIGRRPKDADYIVRHVSLDQLTEKLLPTGGAVTKLKLRDGREVGRRLHVRGLGLIEIALPRREISTGPSHRDFEIVADPGLPLVDDAFRRDFTMNALYKNVHTDKIIDPLRWGRRDITDKCIRTTHRDSFRDDPLRMLRALRFVSTLGFHLLPSVEQDIRLNHECCDGLTDKGLSGTVLDELTKLLGGGHAAYALRIARDTGVLTQLLPELAPMIGFDQESRYHSKSVDEHTFDAIYEMGGSFGNARVAWALLFHDSGKPETAWRGEDGRLHYYSNGETEDHEDVSARLADQALRRLNAPNKLRHDVVTLVQNHMVSLSGRTKPTKVRRWRVKYGHDLLIDLLSHRLADVQGKDSDPEAIAAVIRLWNIALDAQGEGVPTSVKELPVDGNDMKALGLEGKQIGDALRQLLDIAVCQPKLNDRTKLLEIARNLKL